MKRKAPRVAIDWGQLPLAAIPELQQSKGPEDVRRWIRKYGSLTATQARLLSRRDMDRILDDMEAQSNARWYAREMG